MVEKRGREIGEARQHLLLHDEKDNRMMEGKFSSIWLHELRLKSARLYAHCQGPFHEGCKQKYYGCGLATWLVHVQHDKKL